MGILQELQNRILIADGAMGTLLYSFGVDYCFEELNLLQPDRITKIHEAYIEAGAEVIQTNTYGANYLKLARYGLEDQVKDINAAAIQIAKKAANGKAYVLGTLGGIRSIKKSAATIEEIKRSFREQLYTFLLEGVDGLLLETFYDLDELKTVLQIARKETNLPIIAQVSIHEVAVLQDGTPLANAFKQLEDLGADVVGLNCRLGPHHITKALEEVPLPEKAFLSAYPNASLPDYIDGRLIYESDAEYFGECAVNLRNQGVRLIGGCCGTTPRHIKAVREKLQGLAPITYKDVKVKQTEPTITVLSKRSKPHLHEIVAKERSVIVELDTPKTLNTTSFMEGAKALKEAGIDALTMADNSLASPRICNMAMAAIVKNELGIRPLVHITCRDRNLIGLQSHLMGLDALGIDQVLAVTGDPTKIGDFPGATSVYDLSSFELISLIKQLNEGITFSGKPLEKKTSFSVAAAFNPNVRHLDKAIKRLEKKIKHGADYFISQPIFDEKKFLEVYEHTKHLSKPIYIGIMPIVSSQNAEFLHNEVPGIKLTDEIREKMARCGSDREKAKMEGIAIAKSLIDAAFDLFNGIYLITPFMRYDMTVKLVQYIHQKCANRVQERKITN
ncbi:bifunctional homocysteine S-methyltransferase/methylenetetrahydrofolate reductase [Calidifontibacillus erzurumensis]|uniref:bifunctional homocysteine S-methyltransferase/methylenetetrahydrofolate reductase n=1 Tax=Calidifontibacillus erzurumensis TaxID=2741433 RepID=UPI0035B56F2E